MLPRLAAKHAVPDPEDGAAREAGLVPARRRRRRRRLGRDRRKPGSLRCRGPRRRAGGHGRRLGAGNFYRGTALTFPPAPATRATSPPGRSVPSGAGGWPGPAAATNSSGTGSRTGRHHGSWRSSASRRPVARIGPKPPSTARPNGTRADHDPVAAGVARRSLTWRQT
jgi:hypothetical protein